MDTKGGRWWGRGGGVMIWEIGIDIYILICIKWITNKNLLYTKIKFKNSKKKRHRQAASPKLFFPALLIEQCNYCFFPCSFFLVTQVEWPPVAYPLWLYVTSVPAPFSFIPYIHIHYITARLSAYLSIFQGDKRIAAPNLLFESSYQD